MIEVEQRQWGYRASVSELGSLVNPTSVGPESKTFCWRSNVENRTKRRAQFIQINQLVNGRGDERLNHCLLALPGSSHNCEFLSLLLGSKSKNWERFKLSFFIRKILPRKDHREGEATLFFKIHGSHWAKAGNRVFLTQETTAVLKNKTCEKSRKLKAHGHMHADEKMN